MQRLALLFDSEAEALEAVSHLWERLKIRGEIEVVPVGSAEHPAFRVDVVSERDLSPAQVEKLPGKRV
jgi:hypothetical protein